MKKVEIDFPSVGEDAVGSIHLGRLYIGDYVVRVELLPDGKMHLFCPHEAQNYIHFRPPMDELMLYGFGGEK